MFVAYIIIQLQIINKTYNFKKILNNLKKLYIIICILEYNYQVMINYHRQ